MSELPLTYKYAITFDGDDYEVIYHPDWMGVDMVDLVEFRNGWGMYKSWFTWLDHTHDEKAVLKAATGFLDENRYSIRKARKAALKGSKPA